MSVKEQGKNSFMCPVMNTLLAPGDEHASFVLSREQLSFLTAFSVCVVASLFDNRRSAFEMPTYGYARC